MCNLCGSTESRIVYEDLRCFELPDANAFSFRMCMHCGLLFLAERPVDMGRYYHGSYIPYQASQGLRRRIKQLFWSRDAQLIRSYLGLQGAIFEIGTANGEYLAAVRGPYRASGLEYDAHMAAEAQRRGLAVVRGDFDQWNPTVGQTQSLVVLNYVFEHLQSPRVALESIAKMLCPRGYVFLRVPNADSFERKLFGKYWHSFDAPRHNYIFTPATIKQYAEAAGFSVVRVIHSAVPNDWVGSIRRILRVHEWHRTERLLDKLGIAALACFLPLTLLGKMFGKSSRILVILQKR